MPAQDVASQRRWGRISEQRAGQLQRQVQVSAAAAAPRAALASGPPPSTLNLGAVARWGALG